MVKKAQSEVITTVLIILLVLAAVFIVYTAVRSMVSGGVDVAQEKAKCIGIDLTITNASAADEKVYITRNAGGPEENVTIKILVGGAITAHTSGSALSQLSSSIYTLSAGALAPGQKVKAAPVLASGYSCDVSSNEPAAI